MKIITVRTDVKRQNLGNVQDAIDGFFAALVEAHPDGIRLTSARIDNSTRYLTMLELDDGVPYSLDAIPEFGDFKRNVQNWIVGEPITDVMTVVASYPHR